ncbi:hypothetical protein QT970_12385 [Microcoleus sp. herbarium8]
MPCPLIFVYLISIYIGFKLHQNNKIESTVNSQQSTVNSHDECNRNWYQRVRSLDRTRYQIE